MKTKFFKISFTVLAVALFLNSCRINEIDKPIDGNVNISTTISASCLIDNTLPELATRSLIDQVTTKAMDANFVRIDEDVKGGTGQDKQDGLYTFQGGVTSEYHSVNWGRGHLLEATVISSPDNTQNIYYRSITFDPVQSYNIIVKGDVSLRTEDTTHFYHTRMVGWYPKNCTLARNAQGKAVYTLFDNSRFDAVRKDEITPQGSSRKRMGVKFTGLDGSKDLMVSNVCEAQNWHSKSREWNGITHGTVPHKSDVHPENGSDIYRSPLGHYTTGPVYSNYFTFKHYLSAVRVWAYADQSLQNLNMWGDLTNVVLQKQPHSCTIWLPEETDSEWGEVQEWSDNSSMDIIRTPMFGDDTNHEDENFEANYPISISGAGSKADKTYLGYALIRPDNTLSMELHTTNGVYVVSVPSKYKKLDNTEVDIFQAGYVYDVMLNLQTSGTIAVLLENESNEHFYDLTTLKEFTVGGQELLSYKYSNCYVVSPNDNSQKRDDGTGTLVPYDGFCFSATTVGNGQSGIISYGSQNMYPTDADISPTSARIIWESSLGLISDVELIYGYVRFRVPDKDKEGNAVIGVFDDNDNILWSWHIWLTDFPKEQTFPIGGTNYTFLDRNLGATAPTWSGAGDVLQTYGLYYQWGRKDPSMGPPEYNYIQRNLITAPYYDYSSEQHNSAHIKQFASPTLRDGVENPLYIIMPSGNTNTYEYNWLYENYNLLWGYNSDVGTMTKTIYDPCPFGYRVSASELGMVFAEGTVTLTDYGQKYTVNGVDFYFPYTGYKGVDRGLSSMVGEWRYVGRKADYQTALYSSTTGGNFLHRGRFYLSKSDSWTEPGVQTYSGNLQSDYTNKRTSAPVRCVKNEDYGVITTDLNMVNAFDPDQHVVIKTTAKSGESSITRVKLYVNYTLSGGEARTDVLFDNTSPSCGSVWSNNMDYTFPNEAFLGNTTGIFEFVFTAQNEHGVVSTTTNSVSRRTVTATYLSWAPSLSGLGGPVVGQPGKISVRIESNALLDVSSVTFDGQPTQSIANSSNNDVYNVTFQNTSNISFNTAGNNTVAVKITLSNGSVINKSVTVPVSAFSISSVVYSNWTPKLSGAGGVVIGQPVNLVATVTSNANTVASVTIGGVATSLSNAVSGSNCVTTCTTTSATTFTTSGNATVAVVVTDNQGGTHNYNITVPVYGIGQGTKQTGTTFNANTYYVIKNGSNYVSSNSAGSAVVVQTSLDLATLFEISLNGYYYFNNTKAGKSVDGTSNNTQLTLSNSGTAYRLTNSSGNYKFYYYNWWSSSSYYWQINGSNVRLNSSATTWNIYAVTFVAP